jgi:hypothetical protein
MALREYDDRINAMLRSLLQIEEHVAAQDTEDRWAAERSKGSRHHWRRYTPSVRASSGK